MLDDFYGHLLNGLPGVASLEINPLKLFYKSAGGLPPEIKNIPKHRRLELDDMPALYEYQPPTHREINEQQKRTYHDSPSNLSKLRHFYFVGHDVKVEVLAEDFEWTTVAKLPDF